MSFHAMIILSKARKKTYEKNISYFINDATIN